MHDINFVLKIFEKENIMDYCEDFDVLRRILDYCDSKVKKFEKVQFKGGNDNIIDELTSRIQQHFKEKSYIDDNMKPTLGADMSLRKVSFFLFLNTDATYKYDIKEDINLMHLFGITPQLSKCLLSNLIWKLNLDKYLYEIIEYSPPWFSIQFLDQIIASIKYIDDPYEVLEKVENLVKAIYGSLCRSDYRQMDSIDKKIILKKFYDFTIDLLRQFYTPDAEKLAQFSKRQFYKYSGYALNHLLDIIINAFDKFETKVVKKLEAEYELYNICQESSPIVKDESNNYSDLVREMQQSIISALHNILQYNVVLVTIDVFMYWVEIDLNETKTLQFAIGEKAYNVLERMKNNSNFGHDVETHLQFIAIRPTTLSEKIKDATIGEILCKLDEFLEYKEKKAWFDELLSRSISYGNDECIESIDSNLKLITVDNILQIIDFLKLEMQTKSDPDTKDDYESNVNEDLLKVLNKALHNFNETQLIHICKYAQITFGPDYNIFQQEDFEANYTQFVNKTDETFDFQEFLRFSFQNPKYVFTKLFDSIFESEQQVVTFCAITSQAYEYTKVYFEVLFMSSFDSEKSKAKFYPHFISETYFQIYSARKWEFFKDFINKNCTDCLNSEQYRGIIPILIALNMIASKNMHQMGENSLIFGDVTAPVLIMAAQIMDKCRWDLISYSDTKEEIVRNCVEFIILVSKKFLPVASEKDKQWISKIVRKSYKPLTQYYFQKFTLDISETPLTFDKFLHPEKFQNSTDIEKFLISTLVRCTTKETEWLAKNDRLLEHISDVILLLNGIVTEMGEEGVYAHYHYCILNYINIIEKFLMPKLTQNSHLQVRDLAFKALNIIDSSPAGIYEKIFFSMYPTLLEIFGKLESIEEDLVKDVNKFVYSMTNTKAKFVFMEKFTAMTTKK